MSALRRRPSRTFLAVSNVSFDIEAGEAVGLIGRNGAGKSTLMRILARVTRPTAGSAEVYGTVGALLEVGTGFHPELTGRDNVFLSGAILGLSKRDIVARYEEIVSFAEIESFIDTPVKRYSSGMYARLGFAVAAFLRPTFLMVDEVLAVGDLAFQGKCLQRMKTLTSEGTAVMFVSHNLLAVADFCTRSLVLADGALAFDGTTPEAIVTYRRSLLGRETRSGGGTGEMTVHINDVPNPGVMAHRSGDPLHVVVTATATGDSREADAVLNVVLETQDGRLAMHLRSDFQGVSLRLQPGLNRYGVSISELPLAPGDYWLWMRLVSAGVDNAAIWDSDRILLEVPGDRLSEGLVQPRHRFERLPSSGPTLPHGDGPPR
jgi:lipopolysaccharide transport system ATP-binding protein